MGKDYRYSTTVLDSGSFFTNLTANNATPLETPGIERAVMTAFGPAKVRYGKCVQSGGCARGELQAFRANQTITNATSGSTTTIVTTGLTANDMQYDLALCHDDAGAAGAAPEGECAPIVSNTTTTVYLDTNNPFSAAVAANDDFTVVSFCKCEDAAAGDEVNELFGIAAVAMTANYWGWFFFDGYCSYALVKASTALTADKALIADTARLSISSTSADQLLVGTTLGRVAASNDLAADVFAVKLDNLGHGRGVSA
jgi:hypothetical protein